MPYTNSKVLYVKGNLRYVDDHPEWIGEEGILCEFSESDGSFAVKWDNDNLPHAWFDLDQLKEKICSCECHIKGNNTMHCFPCCDLTYFKYINEDGTIDYDKLNKLRNEKQTS